MAVDGEGNLYIADTGNCRVRRIEARTGIITTVAGPSSALGEALSTLWAVAVDGAGDVYYSYASSHFRIVKINSLGQVLATYGKGIGASEDGTPLEDVNLPPLITNMAVDLAGNLAYTDAYLSRVRRLNFETGKLETLAGCGPHPINESGPAIAATLRLTQTGDLAFLPDGELVIGDAGNFILRKVDLQGDISTVGGPWNGLPSTSDDKPALGAYVYANGVEMDAAGRIYVGDIAGQVWRIDPDGIMHRIAGIGSGFSGDGGPALDAELCQPLDIALDTGGNLFIADTNNNRIRRVDAQTGIITTVAGSGPVNGEEHFGRGSFCGDGGPATETCLNSPYGVALDPAGNLFIADYGNDRIRKVDANHIITTVVKDIRPTKLAFDSVGQLYVADHWNINRVDQAGRITPLAGQSVPGFSGDGGPALLAKTWAVSMSTGIAFNAEGDLFFLDNGDFRVRAIRNGAYLYPPAITRQPASLRIRVGQTTTLVVEASGFPSLSYQWQKDGVDIPGATNAIYTIANTQLPDTGAYTVAVTNLMGSVSSNAASVTVFVSRAHRHLRGR